MCYPLISCDAGAAEHDPLLELLRDAVGDQLSVDFRLAHFFDVHCDRHTQLLAEFALEVLDVFALLADHDTRTCRVDRDAGILGGTLDQHARNGCILELLLQVLAHLDVFGQHAGEVFVAGVPAAGPIAADREAEAGGVDFLSHSLPAFSCQPSRTHGTWAC